MARRALFAAALVLLGCQERDRTMRARPPEALPVLPPSVQGVAAPAPAEPGGLTVLQLSEGRVTLNGGPLLDPPQGQVVLAPDSETFVAQVAGLLAGLDDHDTRVFLRGNGGAYPVLLRDEPAFRAWLDDGEPGKLRVIQRADGLELSTNMGKLPGPDANGPSVPTRDGKLDVATMRDGLGLLLRRFTNAKDAALVPSYGTPLAKVAEALGGFWGEDGPLFERVYLVYPRPGGSPDAGIAR